MQGSRFSVGHQIAIAVAIGVCAGIVSALLLPLNGGADFRQFHYHARVWLSGRDPYLGGYPVMRSTRVVPEPFFYPLPALFVVAPFAALPLSIAIPAFVGVSSAVLAFGIARHSPERFPLFLGSGFFVSIVLGQWSPLLSATMVLAPLAWLVVIKPNLGVAITAANPGFVALVGGAAVLLASLAIQPNWPLEWLRNLHAMPPHPAPLFVPGGVVVLLAILRWKRPEARLLVAMACVPQLMYFADQLPLWFVPQTRRESIVLSASSVVAWGTALVVAVRSGVQPAFFAPPFVLAGVYIPALIMVLRRPNEGPLPPALAYAKTLVRRRLIS